MTNHCEILDLMSYASILSEEFAEAAATAGLRARQDALAAGHPVVFVDDLGQYIEEMPDGTRHEIYLRPGAPREFHIQILGEASATVR